MNEWRQTALGGKTPGGADTTDAEALLPDVCAEVELEDMKKKSADD